MNTGDTALLLLGIYHPPESLTPFFAGLLHINGKRLFGIQVAISHSLQNLHTFIRRKNFSHRFPNQVLRTMTKVQKERFIAKHQSSFNIEKRPECCLVQTHWT
jgi:hypothetical protein